MGRRSDQSRRHSMSSPFEGHPLNSRIFSALAAPDWPKIIAAFATGAACTVLVTTVAIGTRKASQPQPAKVAQHSPASVTPDVGRDAKPVPGTPPEQSAEASPAAPPQPAEPRRSEERR